MDPQACWEDIKAIIRQGKELTDPDELVEHLNDLALWIKSGGFYPKP